MGSGSISAIVPTIGRPASLARLLESLANQTRKPDEVIVADASTNADVANVIAGAGWHSRQLQVTRIEAQPPNAVGQRLAAIAAAKGDSLLLLDDDVVLDPDCVERLADLLDSDAGVAAACSDYTNDHWPVPPPAWRFYLRWIAGLREGEWQGKVVGPLLRFGYHPTPATPAPMQWFGTANTLVKRSAYDRAGGFSTFFLRRSTMNEDVDLSLKVSRIGRILFCPGAKLAHFHEPSGRVTAAEAAEDDLFNRYQVLNKTVGKSRTRAFLDVLVFTAIETVSNAIGCVIRLKGNGLWQRSLGRGRAIVRLLSVTG